MKSLNINQILNAVITSKLFIKYRAAIVVILSLIIVWRLVRHGEVALGALMFIEKVAKLHDNDRKSGGGNAAEEVLHISNHGDH